MKMLIKTNNYHHLWYAQNESTNALGSFDLFQRGNGEDATFELWAFGIYGAQNRNKGFGQKMLKEAILQAEGKPIKLYVYKDNNAAIHIYQKAGFQIVGEYMNGLAWTMKRNGEVV
jgi:ribosomal protein S18 acetylase RimI-like enzyme